MCFVSFALQACHNLVTNQASAWLKNDPVAGKQTEYSGSRIADALCRGNHLPGWLLEIRSAFEKSESGFSSSSSCSSSSSILAGFFEDEDEDDDEDDSSP
jgi:hypothetical protein